MHFDFFISQKSMQLSIIIPCFNEEQSIDRTLNELIAYLKTITVQYEILVVDDGSTDATPERLAKHPVRVIRHQINRGYGASLKTGSSQAAYDWLLFYDADGQHKPEYIASMLKEADHSDMVVGAREGYKGPFIRQPGKMLIRKVAEYLSGAHIPDLNSGLRLVKKELFKEFINLYPDGFSLSTTITIAALKNHYKVTYVPIAINKRTGTSTVKWSDMLSTLMLISRLIVLFSPLRLFITLSGICIALGTLSIIYNVIVFNWVFKETTYFLFTIGIIIFFFGVIADQIAEIRRRLR